jgi:hypothetical protein
VPDAAVEAGRADAHEDLAVTGVGDRHLPDLEDVGRAVPAAHDRPHRAAARRRERHCGLAAGRRYRVVSIEAVSVSRAGRRLLGMSHIGFGCVLRPPTA